MARELAQIYNALNRGDLAVAEALCRAALRENPFDAPVIDILGVAARGQGDNLRAIEHFRNAISLEPKMGLYRCHLGLALKSLGRRDEAKTAFEDAIAADPASFEAAYNFSQLLNEIGEATRAIEMARHAVKLDAKFAPARNNLGVFLQGQGRLEEAAQEYRQAIRFDPNHVRAHANLANALSESDRIEDALRLLDTSLRRWPKDTDLLNARCNALVRRNELDRALGAADATLAVDPNYAQAHYTKGMILLAQDRYAEGWPEYEWRVKRSQFSPQRHYTQPRWRGEPLAGKTLLVHWEQGFGDVIQFARYLPLLKERIANNRDDAGAKIVVDCQEPLVSLIASLGPFEQIGDFGDSPPPFDLYVPIMSLPMIFVTTPTTIPAQIPYLTARPAEDVAFADIASDTIKVGFTWASRHGDSLRRKVMSPRDFAPLFKLPGYAFHALQYGHDGRDLGPFLIDGSARDLSPLMGDFARNAALIAKLDMIVAIDTYVVHLAAALGKPAWVMLPFSADWRWGLGRTDCPWYPGMRLFRQPKPGDWKSVVVEVARALGVGRRL